MFRWRHTTLQQAKFFPLFWPVYSLLSPVETFIPLRFFGYLSTGLSSFSKLISYLASILPPSPPPRMGSMYLDKIMMCEVHNLSDKFTPSRTPNYEITVNTQGSPTCYNKLLGPKDCIIYGKCCCLNRRRLVCCAEPALLHSNHLPWWACLWVVLHRSGTTLVDVRR